LSRFSERLRQLRTERDLRQADLAKHLGIAQTTIANYEQQARFPNEERLSEIAEFFSVSLDYLLGRTDVSVDPSSLASFSSLISPNASSLSPVAADYLSTLMSGRRDHAERLILNAVTSGESVSEIFQNILRPTLRVVGTMWEAGEIDIAQEHYFSEATGALMTRLEEYLMVPDTCRGTVVLTVAGAESHVIGLRMVGAALREAGWALHYLGANVPARDLFGAVVRENARVLALSATMASHVDSVARTIEYVRSRQKLNSYQPLSIIVGGLAFAFDAQLWKRVGADGYAPDAPGAVEVVEQLMRD
jgi:methanogenic corrinoid protein MtbC1